MRTVLLLCLMSSAVFGQAAAPKDEAPKEAPAESAAMREARHSFMLVSTRAVALFKTADNIDARLQATGSTLHPSIATLRLRIEHHLDQAEAALDKGDAPHADEHTKTADELVNRLARRIGGE